ncbi:MAG: hypothetical protein P4L85_20220 [Paludisphaera borealis]|uniref:hypothetical protein n=1 Tax=Paludisphaera borealis TaxID=1387353 RepID=UPI00284F1449|nr:hypothetical protein [Paludisphaera borealis]MDR3621689.1 hypothetical protein [Paludisphaera borealis]
MFFDLRSRRSARGALAMLVALSVAGCSGGVANPVDPDRARVALKSALDHWKSGGDPLSMPTSATPMTVQDLEWQSGAKLVDYEVLGDGEPADANLRVKVKLTLAGKGKNAEKTVNYLVTTSPAVTVFRDAMRR